ncbi:MAG TPA: prephenate dehydrogenase [Candidatus Acidoferrales bacterium]|nr:prephenate dehydrogenase [Candidatus Acidoferrales bacterium]
MPFRRIAVVGTGLIGGSFALALRKRFAGISVIGYDRASTLVQARALGAIDDAAADIASAVRGADLVYLALPIGASIEALATIAKHAEPHALVTDAGSTKALICRVAKDHFRGDAKFLGAHPMTGKEHSGIDHADPELFHKMPYLLMGPEATVGAREKIFEEMIEAIGARPVWTDPETHDWGVGIVSHLPQLLSVALARVVQDETDETGLPLSLAGPGLQDMLRLAGSPYDIWRDILLTNTDNVSRALDRLAQAVDYLRTNLARKELKEEFLAANELYKQLKKAT